MSNVVVFLQNAWSSERAGTKWPRANWLAALKASRSGQRLCHLVTDYGVCENTTPIVGATPDSVAASDANYILKILAYRKPLVVVTCGLQAEKALSELWEGPLLAVPHPAARVLTNALYVQARGLLDAGHTTRIALRQRRGSVAIEELQS